MTFKTLTPPTKTNKQVREYVEAVEAGLDSYFVVQNGKGWYVRKASVRTSNGKLFPTKETAIEQAKKLSTKMKSEYLIFNNNGTLIARKPIS